MGLFEYRGQDARDLVLDSLELINYAYHGLFQDAREQYTEDGYISTSFFEGAFNAIVGTDPSGRNDDAVADVNAAGWTVLTASDLGLPESRTNAYNTFTGLGQFNNAQADVLAKYDENGTLIQIGLVIRGTTGPSETLVSDTLGDVIDFLEFFQQHPNYTQEAFSDVLEAIRDLAVANGLTGSDVLVTGHSLGGGATTNLAETSDEFLDGFFVDSNYIASAAHYVAEDGQAVLSNGAEVFSYDFENDPVPSVIAGPLPDLLGNDNEYEFSTDNIVLFNDFYDTAIFAAGTSLLNVLNWTAHLDHTYLYAFQQIISSEFYDEMERDSLIIVSDLSDQTRDSTWVGDIDLALADTGHFGDGAFVLGSKFDDKLFGNDGDDTIEGFAGNDKLRGNGGDDRLLGGAGNDEIEGGKGDDTITDGAGQDEMEGGSGDDVFVLVADGEYDEITDFREGDDLIDVSAWGVTSVDQLDIDRKNVWTTEVSFGDELVEVNSASFWHWISLESNDFIFA